MVSQPGTRSRVNPTTLSSLKRKERNKKVTIRSIMKIEGAWKIEQNQARSKPDPVDQPVRTARTTVHHYNSTQYCSTEIIPWILPFFLQTNIISQTWPSGGKGVSLYLSSSLSFWPLVMADLYSTCSKVYNSIITTITTHIFIMIY